MKSRENEIAEWIFNTVSIYAHSLCRNNKDLIEETISESNLFFVKNHNFAQRLYDENNHGLVKVIVKHIIYDINAQSKNIDFREYSRYQKISKVCEQYDIQMTCENAYKISALMDDKDYGIQQVCRILKSASPPLCSMSNLRDIYVSDNGSICPVY